MKTKRFSGHVALLALFMVGCGGTTAKHSTVPVTHTAATKSRVVKVPKAVGDATLANLTISGGILKPAFNPDTILYQVGPLAWVGDSMTVTPTANNPSAKIAVNGVAVATGTASAPISLSVVTTIGITVTAADGVTTKDYIVVVHKTSSTYLKASNTEAEDRFGFSVSMSGDMIVVGAPYEDSSATGVNGNQTDNSTRDSGAAYVFTCTAGVWTQQAYLKASNTDAEDWFGFSVSMSGDTIVVGAPFEDSNATGVNGNQVDNSAPESGAAYVFTCTAGVWSQRAYLKASNPGTGYYFGLSVSISGDTIVVGAKGEASNAIGVNGNQSDNSAPESGAAYVFTRTGDVWTQQAYLKASNAGTDDWFGHSVSICNDTIVVGACQQSSNVTGANGKRIWDPYWGSGSGAGYVFTRTAGTWSQQAYLKASNVGRGDKFGWSVSISGETIVVGAFDEDSNAAGINGNEADNSAEESGAVYVFTRTAGVWSQQAYLKTSNTEAFDRFGISVSISGNTIAVGACQENSNAIGVKGNQADNSAIYAGAVYVFTRTAGVWSQQAYLKASNTEASDLFGYSVSISGNTIVLGAYGESSSATGVNGNQANNSAPSSGAAYIY